jgi:hypothetical protein
MNAVASVTASARKRAFRARERADDAHGGGGMLTVCGRNAAEMVVMSVAACKRA